MRPAILFVALTTTILAAPLPSPGLFDSTDERSLEMRDPNYIPHRRSLKVEASQEGAVDHAHSLFTARVPGVNRNQELHAESTMPNKNAQDAGIESIVETQGGEPEVDLIPTSHNNGRNVISPILASREAEPINRINDREAEPVNRINDREDEAQASNLELDSRAVRGSDKRTVKGSDKRTVRGSNKRTVRGSNKRTVRGFDKRTVRGSDKRNDIQ